MSTTILYHGPSCRDGWTAAWLCKKAYPNAELVPVQYGNPLPAESVYEGRETMIVDFSYPPDQMAVLAAKAKSVVCLDHHRSAVRKWDGVTPPDNVRLFFDETQSGAMLTWKYLNFFVADDPPGDPPWLVRLVQDRDLWAWALPDSRALNAYIASVPQTAEAWDFLASDLEFSDRREELAEVGEAILRTNRQYVEAVVKNAVYWPVAEGVSVPVLNTTHLHSEVGEELSKGFPFSLTYLDDLTRGLRIWSFRSAPDGMDVSKVASAFWEGGGGHEHAGGAQTPLSEPMASVAYRLGQAYKSVKGVK